MAKKNFDVALIVHGCDRYEFLYKGFAKMFAENWDHNINCNCYFATEEKKVSINNFINIQSGKGEWTDRLSYLLTEKITEKYILYTQEDMWFNKKVNADFFNQLFVLAAQNDWKQVKLHSAEVYKTMPTQTVIEGFRVGMLDNRQSDYLMSHQITLWNKEFLLNQLQKKEHPWKNELKGTKRLLKMNAQIFQIDYFEANGETTKNNLNDNLSVGSEYKTVSSNAALNEFVVPFIKEFKNYDGDYLKYATALEHNYNNQLTHDGKPKPHKVEIIGILKGKIWRLRKKIIDGLSNGKNI